jgi:hypothetical protein
MFLKMTKLLAELNCNYVKEVKGLVGVHAQLCESMPLRTGEEQSQNIFIVWLWEEGLKYGDGALIRQIRSSKNQQKDMEAYLKKIFEVPSSHPLHFRGI